MSISVCYLPLMFIFLKWYTSKYEKQIKRMIHVKEAEYKNELYSLVDEGFISKFKGSQIDYMKSIYYETYLLYCKVAERTPLEKDLFFHNMRRRRIQLYQLCCPYCGKIEIIIIDKKVHKEPGLNYCSNCGRGSAYQNIMSQAFRFSRMFNIMQIGITTLKERHPEKETWLIGYDCYQMLLVEFASIIEVVFRDYFDALFFINNHGIKNDYVEKTIRKQNGNDFMNIEKANAIFRRAFGIDIRAKVGENVWNDLIDIVNLRNTMIHNNGAVDNHFKTTNTYQRVKSRIDGHLFKLEEADLRKYLDSVVYAIVDISNLFLDKYFNERNTVIANYYFNRDL